VSGESTVESASARWIVAPDKFKGTFTAGEVAASVAAGISDALGPGAGVEECPVADGGEGTARALVEAWGGRLLARTAHDPLGREIEAEIAVSADGRTAVVEVAAASGLSLLTVAERDAEAAGSAGTGELILAALAEHPQRIVLAAGGSASTDGGVGALSVIDAAGGLAAAKLIVLADVQTPFEQAAAVFAPQKGADEHAVGRLSARLQALAVALPRDPRGIAMTGAAGGLAGGLWARYGAQLWPGAPWVLDALGFDARIAGARGVVTGEGRLDATTLEGKAVAEIARRCARARVPLHVIAADVTLAASGLDSLELASISTAGTVSELRSAARAIARRSA
jgi:glycerate kinase